MADQSAELLEKLRQQFDAAPYPKIPLEQTSGGDVNFLHLHDLMVPHYMRSQRIVQPTGKLILDAGCGSGFKALVLAEANPGAKVVGVDLSQASVNLARERLKHHGFENVEFHCLTIEELPSLGLEFDYINCDEVLYLLPDPVIGLKAMKSVLKQDGIIRANFHHSSARSTMHQMQEFFTRMGLMEDSPDAEQLSAVRDIMKGLSDGVLAKARTWGKSHETDDDLLLANHLLRGDKSINVLELFDLLRATDLEFISLVNWWQWDLTQLFENFNDLPVEIAFTLANKSVEEQLHLFALLHPNHRLIDLWCGHPGQAHPYALAENWTEAQWRQAKVHLYPQLKVEKFEKELISAIDNSEFFEISKFLQKTNSPIKLDSLISSCLLQLMGGPRSVEAIAQHWKKLRPLNLVTLEPTTDAEAFDVIQTHLIAFERQGYVLLELVD